MNNGFQQMWEEIKKLWNYALGYREIGYFIAKLPRISVMRVTDHHDMPIVYNINSNKPKLKEFKNNNVNSPHSCSFQACDDGRGSLLAGCWCKIQDSIKSIEIITSPL